MMKVLDYIPVGNNMAVTLDGLFDLKSGACLSDENGNKFIVVSVGTARYNNPDDVKKFTDVLLTPNIKIGNLLSQLN